MSSVLPYNDCIYNNCQYPGEIFRNRLPKIVHFFCTEESTEKQHKRTEKTKCKTLLSLQKLRRREGKCGLSLR